MEEWIHEGWCYQEGELLLQFRERQDKRKLLGDNYRVLQDQESQDERRLVLVILDEDKEISSLGEASSRRLLLSGRVLVLNIKRTQQFSKCFLASPNLSAAIADEGKCLSIT